MKTMTDTILEALHHRILDDEQYCRERIGYVPDDADVDAAIGNNGLLERAEMVVAEALDPIEAQIWHALSAIAD